MRAVGAEEGAEAEMDDADAGAGPAGRVRRGVSAGKPASVDGEDGAVDVFRRRRGEEDGGAGDVGGLAPAAGRDAVEDRLVAVGVGAQRLGVVGLDVAGRDGVDVDAARRPLVGEELGQAGDAVLGGGVGGDADAALEGRAARRC